ncbi:hypothetical protein D3C84_1053540 [compost metagenome]
MRPVSRHADTGAAANRQHIQLTSALQAEIEGIVEQGFCLAVEAAQGHVHTTTQPAQAGAGLEVQALVIEL